MSFLNEFVGNKVVEEITRTMDPEFYDPKYTTGVDNNRYNRTEFSAIYSSGLYNLVQGRTVLTKKGERFFEELSKVKFEVETMDIGRGSLRSLTFFITSGNTSS